jgi:hypothetical protein
MKPVATKLVEFNTKKDLNELSFPKIQGKDIEEITGIELSEDFKEAIAILGLDQPAFSFSDDYGWMIETTKQILLKEGIAYFRKNVFTLMTAWDKFSKS